MRSLLAVFLTQSLRPARREEITGGVGPPSSGLVVGVGNMCAREDGEFTREWCYVDARVAYLEWDAVVEKVVLELRNLLSDR